MKKIICWSNSNIEGLKNVTYVDYSEIKKYTKDTILIISLTTAKNYLKEFKELLKEIKINKIIDKVYIFRDMSGPCEEVFEILVDIMIPHKYLINIESLINFINDQKET